MGEYSGTENYFMCDFTDLATGATCNLLFPKVAESSAAAPRIGGDCDTCYLTAVMADGTFSLPIYGSSLGNGIWLSAVAGIATLSSMGAMALALMSF